METTITEVVLIVTLGLALLALMFLGSQLARVVRDAREALPSWAADLLVEFVDDAMVELKRYAASTKNVSDDELVARIRAELDDILGMPDDEDKPVL
jgi:hypothetical protein